MPSQNRQKGQQAERQAEKLLRNKGLGVLCRNFSCQYGEIDLICLDKNCLVLVEVKARYSPYWGSADQAVNRRKWERIGRAGDFFRLQWPKPLPEATRIDVIGFEKENNELIVRHYEDTRP